MKNIPFRKMGYAFLMSALLAGCGNTAAPETKTGDQTAEQPAKPADQTLDINIKTEPPTADPGLADELIGIAVAKTAFDGLIRMGEDGKLHESVAESYEISPDLLTYTFKLRDTKWSNGDPVTAHDFEFAWKRVLDPKTASPYAYQLYYIKNGEKANGAKATLDEVGVKALDDKTLQVTLENPAPFFLELVSSVTYLPVNKKVVEADPKWAGEAKTFVGNGPYIMETWEHKNKIVFKKNPNYWDASKVKMETINMSMIEDSNTELSMFDSGELDWAGSPLGDIPTDALASKADQLKTQPTAGTYWYTFNTKAAPFNNVKIRKAFAYAIDRKAIVDNIVQQGGQPAYGILPPSMALKPEGYFKDAQTDEAKKLLEEGMKEAGLTTLPEITILYNTSELHQQIATAIQDQWRKALGVEVKLKNMELKVVRQEMTQGNFQIARASWIGDFNDPVNFLEVFREPTGTNKSNWSDPKLQELLKASAVEKDVEKRKSILAEADAIVADAIPVTPIYYYTYKWLQKDNLKGVVIDALGYPDYKYARFE
ncbi:peptide ABC transporter substrate-binding protein [Brevibacillus dissolubilis]|uniref:peptide ABC transporter substrate-binding protein n=1 Tax=Brevibacillus dissolubilis TaxID=1844116 RepID=UPI001115C57F|nr:peptide ABC transporter substrate-binding protein [Brevibacillus dissolubilis]